MGFIKAFSGALGGSFADQWQDFLMPRSGVPATAAVFEAVPKAQNAGRGSNTKGSENIITNGSKIVVPEGTALITLQDGAITNFIAEPGGFIFSSSDPNSKSFFGGDLFAPISQTFDRFKSGGQPNSQQLAFYVNLKEIPNNKFGTQNTVYWQDTYLNAQVGAIARGTYTLKIVDPILFVKNFVPAKYLQANAPVFDFADMNNDAATQLFNEVVSTLSAAFSNYANDPSKGKIMNIQGDQIGFAQAMSKAVEDAYQWKSSRGLEIIKTAILGIDYDEDTQKLLSDVKKADALSGARGNAFMQQAMARGLQSAGENPNGGGAAAMAFMGMGMNAAGGMMQGVAQPATNTPNPFFQQNLQPAQGQVASPSQPANSSIGEDATTKLLNMKKLLDAGAISQEEYDKVKEQLLGI